MNNWVHMFNSNKWSHIAFSWHNLSNHIQKKSMKCIFCCHSQCQVNIHYCFLRNVERELSKSPSNSANKIQFQLYSKYINKIYGTLSKDDRRPIPLCVTELIRSLSPDETGWYTGFRYADGTMIDQLDECQLKAGEEVFHIQVFILAIDVNILSRSLR